MKKMNVITKEETYLSIQSLIRNVQDELMSSEFERISKGLPPLFEVDSLELEIKFVVKREQSGRGKIDFRLIAMEAGKNDSLESTHVLKLRLKPSSNSEEEEKQNVNSFRRGFRPSETKKDQD